MISTPRRRPARIGLIVTVMAVVMAMAPAASAQLEAGVVAIPADGADQRETAEQAILADGGGVVVFHSSENLTQSASSGGLYAYEVATGATEQIDVQPNGAGGGPGSQDDSVPTSLPLDVSADGRYVLFWSYRTGLDDRVANGFGIYLRDRQAATTTLLSLEHDGDPYDGRDRTRGSLSDDGSTALLVVENSFPKITEAEEGCTNVTGFRLYAVNTATAAHELLTVREDGCGASQGVISADLSADGSTAVFQTQAPTVIPGREIDDGNQIVLHDLASGGFEWLTEGANGDSYGPRVNANGSRVVFASDATNLVADDANFRRDVFVLDRTADQTTLVSRRAADATPGLEDSGSTLPQTIGQDISDDGRFVAFHSEDRLAGPEPTGSENFGHTFRWMEGTPVLRADVRDDGGYPDAGSRAFEDTTVAGTGSVLFATAARDLVSGRDRAGWHLALGNATPGAPPPPPEPPPADPTVIIDEAVAISERRFGTGGTAEGPPAYAIVATAESFADALSGAVLTQRGPMLFVRTDALPDATLNELNRVLDGSGTVYVLGGTAAVSQGVEDALVAAGYTIERLSGGSRFETSTAIAAQARELLGDTDEVALARAFGPEGNPTAAWADSVTGGGWAADTGTPIVLTPSDSVHPAVQTFLDSDSPGTVRLLGGTAALDAGVEAATGGVRTAGATRSDTARQIALELWGQAEDGERRYLILDATNEFGWGYGLAGAGLAADGDAPVLATAATTNPPETLEAVAGCGGQVTLLPLGPIGAGLLEELDGEDDQAC